MMIPTKRTICRGCKQIIRRPVDHSNCPGATDNWFLDIQDYTQDQEVTKEIKIPETIKSSDNFNLKFAK